MLNRGYICTAIFAVAALVMLMATSVRAQDDPPTTGSKLLTVAQKRCVAQATTQEAKDACIAKQVKRKTAGRRLTTR